MKKTPPSDPHPTYARLLLAAKRLRSWDGDADIVRGVQLADRDADLTLQRIGNWRTRGVAKDGLVDICSIIGCRPAWIRDGTGIMEDIGAGVGDTDIQEAIEILASLHGRQRTKAVAILEREARDLKSAAKTSNAS